MPSRQSILLVITLACLGSVAHTLLAADGLPRRDKVQADLVALEAENRQAEGELTELRAQLHALRSRPDVQERVVRRELGFVRDGDLVLEVADHR